MSAQAGRSTPCPSCRAPRPAGRYLCEGCWDQLPAPTRRALTRRDGLARQRLRELFDQVHGGRVLSEIEVTR